jgi:uncharacterized protein YecE (DUF72 family)
MDCYGAQNPASMPVFIACAGWSVPTAVQAHFPCEGSHLERYAAVFPAVEINTSFYRPHLPATYARWRESVPAAFRFAVKVPKEITHTLRMQNADAALERFAGEVTQLREKLGCLLVQLPPTLRYDEAIAQAFFQRLRRMFDVALACEPRHPTWFTPDAAQMLETCGVAYVAADPPIAPLPHPAEQARTVYIRLHGSPEMYHSSYSEAYLDALAERIHRAAHAGKQVWCVFDNTASGAAQPNALSLLARLRAPGVPAMPQGEG